MARRSSRSLWAAKLEGRLASPSDTALPVARGFQEPFRGVILGIDPSLRGTGLAVLEVRGRDQFVLRASTTLKLSDRYDFVHCLGRISQVVSEYCQLHRPDHVAVEETIYVQNFRTAQILGAARGAAIGVVAAQLLPVHEYAPRRIKQAVVGFGAASKEQVAATVRQLLHLPEALPFDESDATAVALCHALTFTP